MTTLASIYASDSLSVLKSTDLCSQASKTKEANVYQTKQGVKQKKTEAI